MRALPLLVLLLGGCASTSLSPPVIAALDCTKLVPASYQQPVAPTPLPPANATAGDLWVSLDGQTTALDQANGRTADLIGIMAACEVQQQAVLTALNPPPWWETIFRPKPKASPTPVP